MNKRKPVKIIFNSCNVTITDRFINKGARVDMETESEDE